MDTKHNYRIYDGTGGGTTEDIHAADLDDAIEQGREWIENGDWSNSVSDDDSGVMAAVRTITLECEVGEILYRPVAPNILSVCVGWDLWEPVWDDAVRVWAVDLSNMLDEDYKDIAAALSKATGGTWTVGVDEVRWAPPEGVEMEEDDEATRDADRHDCSGSYSDSEPDCPVDEGWDRGGG